MLKYYKTIKECCQYLDIIYKKNYTVSNNYTVSKNTEKIFFVKRNSKKDVKEEKCMKKRNLALLLALTMVAASFVGCGDKKEKASDNGSVKQEAFR